MRRGFGKGRVGNGIRRSAVLGGKVMSGCLGGRSDMHSRLMFGLENVSQDTRRWN
jgi:hypothetical protein